MGSSHHREGGKERRPAKKGKYNRSTTLKGLKEKKDNTWKGPAGLRKDEKRVQGNGSRGSLMWLTKEGKSGDFSRKSELLQENRMRTTGKGGRRRREKEVSV